MNNNLEKYYKYIWLAVFVVLAILSFTLFHNMFLKWGFVKQAIVYLDNKTNTILGLTAASSSASVAVTMIPGDIGTPIANKLADISSYSIIILAAVHLEKPDHTWIVGWIKSVASDFTGFRWTEYSNAEK